MGVDQPAQKPFDLDICFSHTIELCEQEISYNLDSKKNNNKKQQQQKRCYGIFGNFSNI